MPIQDDKSENEKETISLLDDDASLLDAHQDALFPDANSSSHTAYRVLARKYRPHRFEDLVGQEAMVRTLSNAFKTGRIAQAYMLTGLRGIGKTTTARIIARALNYEGVEGFDGPSVNLPELGVHCQDIMESRHMDVMEMDAASNRGIGDIRELISNVQYAPVLARYKVYILDEVHMLTTEAFNALLKTLEEPPEHVKFIFATTDPRKVPVTILSRCQRFDLKRLNVDMMRDHLSNICHKEGVKADDEALSLIARASEGSVRDGLSLLDQAIVLSDGDIKLEHAQSMLGLAEGMRGVSIISSMMKGEVETALCEVSNLINRGADPYSIGVDLSELIHGLTRSKILGSEDHSFAGLDSESGDILMALSQSVSHSVLSRAWQMLMQGLNEIKQAPDAAMALEMVVIRICYAAHLPAPDRLLSEIASKGITALSKETEKKNELNPKIEDMGINSVSPEAVNGTNLENKTSPSAQNSPAQEHVQNYSGADDLQTTQANAHPMAIPRLESFEDIVALVGEKRDVKLKFALENHVIPQNIQKGHLSLILKKQADSEEIRRLEDKLFNWTGQRWRIALSEENALPPSSKLPNEHQEEAALTLREKRQKQKENKVKQYENHPEISAILAAFPSAQITNIREIVVEQDMESEFTPLPEDEEAQDDIEDIDF